MQIAIEGGVSPLKKRGRGKGSGKRRRGFAGKAGRANTATKRGRRGFSKAGPKGVNRHGYGALTRFKPRKIGDWSGPLSSATTPKSGDGGGGGGSTTTSGGYNINIDNSIKDAFNQEQNQWNYGLGEPVITKETKTETRKKKYPPSERACNEERRKTHFPNDQAGFDKECDKYKKHRNSPDYKPSNKTETVTTTTDVVSGGSGSAPNQVMTGHTIDDDKSVTLNNKKSSPTTMKSHAWHMLQNMQKARGGTQK